MTDLPFDLDERRGMAAQKATELRREVEANLREVRVREADLENRMMTVPAASWPEAAVKARHLLNLYAVSLLAQDTRHRALVAALFDDFARLWGRAEASVGRLHSRPDREAGATDGDWWHALAGSDHATGASRDVDLRRREMPSEPLALASMLARSGAHDKQIFLRYQRRSRALP
ncbi:hypothetical protein GCM10010987_25640 [Bradyrhizobium guangdongense]|uniref:Uncharacterized protein n=1 Tax=Bradyrhizobium guangdongense TaxID=1325090 RepID=A0AA88B6F5_9BRAD|nr:hypothetical protein GCM10010987_25640 [Bradyrhizobium guangdongense]